MKRVVVIGAGVGGLAAAARLAALGHSVTVVEQAPTVGGKLGVHREAGFTFDTGPSLVTLPWTLLETLEATGGTPENLPLRRLDPIARYRFADDTWLDAWSDEATFKAELDRHLGLGAGVQWGALMERAERVWDASEQPILRSALRGPLDLLPLAARPRALHAVAPHRTLRSLGREYLSDPRLRMMLDRYATYSGSDPRRAPAALVTVPYAERTWGGWYIDGGLRTIATVLTDRITALGGTVATGTAASRILTDGAAATGVKLADGTRIEADVVVANADAQILAAHLLPPANRRPLRRRLRHAPRSLAGYVLLLGVRTAGLSGAAADMAAHTVLFPADYDDEFDSLFGRPSLRRAVVRRVVGATVHRHRYVPDPTIYISVPDDPSVAPAGHQAWFVLVNAPRTDQATSPPDGYADHILRLMAARGVDVRHAVTLRVERPPAVLEETAATPGGAIYGTSSNGPLAAFLRPPNVSDLQGLFLVGGSAHPGGGLPLVLLSAEIVAGQVGAA
ncbi:phytoene desaturase family protein [Euzebya tangerina]|uniref:phytoene desaturase family protein n=1 Tax=Euzebya tangerina TaxID=591198 RepID=UPI000E30CC81|nr:phytoene desaturase family protein [Euzebya tangerina]